MRIPITICAEAVSSYDEHKLHIVKTYNKKYLKADARRAIKKWAKQGSVRHLIVEPEDSALYPLKARLASLVVRTDTNRMKLVADEVAKNLPERGSSY
ncbi:uncharacterized protein FFUJ_01157 [Fusarium fujikuroi IMI 58289]|uniref:Uncharacterized protein n=1 Tax=Gibberella fujikuroi (strain CBS 195.34 / IMI 58289 / NRRL A-6831) TaxID=1279085 RepID=S0DSE5_GIBF5|nr:uncharacterized protein FFUJ_01157 [Fusarium fujikuroi IMI 58289]QGI58759.1 hypothetical protein CEK27_000884 [Fusarium fujikuroi]QGI89669.1 hypothetical protein CEK26_000884 [Fusarium fujikuroi]CCT63483.1 uncharacterized protein FFUJ_01157 [Fusarium fujikuroi IMI 58289]